MRWLLLLLVGCYAPTPPAGAPCGEGETCPSGLTCVDGFCGGGGVSDGPITPPEDSDVDGPPDACTSFATQLDTCTVSATDSLTLSGALTYNTDTHELLSIIGAIAVTSVQVDTATGRLDLIVVDSLTLTAGSTLRVVGKQAFGIVAFGSINLNGTIDASNNGAGARGRIGCGTSAGGNGVTNAAGGSGGGGGAMRGTGGAGGKGDANQVPVNGGAGGAAIALPIGLLGGCPGGNGGGNGGIPGEGGGAVYVVARGMININGVITVGGGGGGHGDPISGAGGGAGSGGMIVIEAPTVNVTGTLAANGGGGGGGADDVDNNEGQDGESAHAAIARAKGGAGFPTAEGGDGGDGGAGATINGAASTEAADNGGGGGGGACGFVAIKGSLSANVGTISPNVSPWP